MADIKFSEFPKATTSKDSDEIAILQDGVNKMIQSPVLESKIINKTVSRVIEQGGASLNVVNLKGIVPTYADLATITPTPTLNDAYQVEADRLVYVYTENGFQTEGEGFNVQPEPTGVVEEGNTQSVSGEEVNRYIENNSLTELAKGVGVKVITSYPIEGKAIVNGTGIVADIATTSITDLIELPLDWTSVEYYHIPSTTYGIAFYASNQNPIALSLPNSLDTIIEIKRSDYPLLEQAKYFRATKYTDNPLYNYKNKLVVKTSSNIIYDYYNIKTFNNYDVWKLKERNAGNYIVEYDYKSLPRVPSAGLKRSNYIDISNWNSIVCLIPQSSSQNIRFYDSSYIEVGLITGDTSRTLKYRYIQKSEFPTAQYLVITGLDSSKDSFVISVSINANNKAVLAESQKDNFIKQSGYITEYLSFSDKDFTKVGLYAFATGALDTSFTQYKAIDLTELPQDWSYIEYDNFLSTQYGLVFFDEFKRFVGHNPNLSTTEYKTVIASRLNFSTARYYAFAWGSTLKPLLFKIVRDSSLSNFRVPSTLNFLNTRMSNLDITDLEEWNNDVTKTDINVGEVFSDSDVSGKPVMRIPTMAITNAGTELAICEARDSGQDRGQFDVILKRRVSGDSWVVNNLFPYNSSTYGRGMNPSIVVDRTGTSGVAGRIYIFVATIKDDEKYAVFSTTSELDLLYRYSDDDGATWSAITSLKSLWDTSLYTGIAPSCASGIQMTDGTLVVPTMIVRNQTWRSGVLYMKLGGNWTFSTFTPRNLDNECIVIEVSNKLILNCRTESQESKYRPVYEYDFANDIFLKSDMDSTFNPYINCKASIIKLSHSGNVIYLMSYPDSSKVENQQTGNTRYNLTVWASTDCKNWIRSYVVQHELSMGYSELAYYNGTLKIIYERGTELEVDIQDLTPLLDKLVYDARVNSKLTAEERLNRVIYSLKDWIY